MGFAEAECNVQPTDTESFAQQHNTFPGLRGNSGQLASDTFHGAYKITDGVLWVPIITTLLELQRQAGMAGGAYAQNAFMRRMVECRTTDLIAFRGILQYASDRGDISTPGSYGDVNASVQKTIRDLQLIAPLRTSTAKIQGKILTGRLGPAGARATDRGPAVRGCGDP